MQLGVREFSEFSQIAAASDSNIRLVPVTATTDDGSPVLVGNTSAALSAVRVTEDDVGSLAVCLDINAQAPLTFVLGVVTIEATISALQSAQPAQQGGAKPLVLKCGRSQIALHPDGRVRIKGDDVRLESMGRMKIQGAVVDLN